jgi:cytochrome oxidase assembly protein ShyY1
VVRTALTPRFLGLLGLVLVVGAVFVQLGRWQLGVAEGKAFEEAVATARARPAVELTSVLQPHTAFPGELSARPVTASGHYSSQGQLLVPGRRLDGRDGAWVITPFVVEETGATLPVLRGFVTDPAGAGPPPTGRLTVEGGLAPPESPVAAPTAEGQIGSVDTSVLVNTWPGELYNGFLFLATEDPASGPQLTKVPTPLGEAGLNWRNAAYAVQWWVFAFFALWLWWRMVREEHRRTTPAVAAAPATPAERPDADAPPPAAAPAVDAGDNGARDHS